MKVNEINSYMKLRWSGMDMRNDHSCFQHKRAFFLELTFDLPTMNGFIAQWLRRVRSSDTFARAIKTSVNVILRRRRRKKWKISFFFLAHTLHLRLLFLHKFPSVHGGGAGTAAAASTEINAHAHRLRLRRLHHLRRWCECPCACLYFVNIHCLSV